jgi:hypothetical protein
MRRIFSRRSVSVSSRKEEQNYREFSIGISTGRRQKVQKIILIEVTYPLLRDGKADKYLQKAAGLHRYAYRHNQ